MDEDSLGLNGHNKISSSNWQIGPNASSLLVESQQLEQQNLQVIQKKETLTGRPLITASLQEKLCFYRAYTSSLSKIELLCMQHNNLIKFIWLHFFNIICKSLPSTYVYVFLSLYAPDHHFYLPKMVPICKGFVIVFIVTAIMETYLIADIAILYLQYVINGFLYKTPWNRCMKKTFITNFGTCACYETEAFSKMFANDNITFKQPYYFTSSNKCFLLAQLAYFLDLIQAQSRLIYESGPTVHNFMFCFIWICAVVQYKQLYRRFVWKVLHNSQMMLNLVLLIIFVHLITLYTQSKNMERKNILYEKQRQLLMDVDIDLLAESMTTPPIVHILSSRSTSELKPSRDSAVVIISNSIHYLFRGIVSYLMKTYCENWIKAPITLTRMNSFSLFYFWTIYFFTLELGDLGVIMFFLLNFIVEFCVLIITLQCLVEAIFREWPCMKPWISIVFLIVIGIMINVFLTFGRCIITFFLCTCVSTWAETIIIFWIYPASRLVDDITFHFGVRPTKLWIISLNIIPIYYSGKIYYMFINLIEVFRGFRLKLFMYSLFVLCIICSSFILGAIYTVFQLKCRQRKTWSQLITPVPEWGPRDFATRQLRKQFDSRNYIGSQAPRDLGRRLIENAELKSYKLDVRYDALARRSTDVRFENDKKTI